MTALMKDVLLFLSTFTVIMLAFASGVSYIFNMASGTYHSHSITLGDINKRRRNLLGEMGFSNVDVER